MLTLLKVAITGGLACGKSSVCRFLRELGAYVVSADAIVHRLLSSDTDLIRKVSSLVGPDVVVDGQLDRSRVAAKVFSHPEMLQSLEQILHPAVLREIEEQYRQVKDERAYSVFVAEIPLLFEIGSDKDFDVTVSINAQSAQCRAWFSASTGHGGEEYDRRMARQLSCADKAKRTNCLISNDGDLSSLKMKTKDLLDQLKSTAKKR